MSTRRSSPMLAAAVATLVLAGGSEVQAHAHLLSATPAANATVASPRMITLHFSEKLMPRFSKFTLSKAGGAAVMVDQHIDKDGLTLVGNPKAPLAPGAYKLDWKVVTADTHRMSGNMAFTVR